MYLALHEGLDDLSIPRKLIELLIYVITPPDYIFLHAGSFLALVADQGSRDDLFVTEVKVFVYV
jgi:hypothetical protein